MPWRKRDDCPKALLTLGCRTMPFGRAVPALAIVVAGSLLGVACNSKKDGNGAPSATAEPPSSAAPGVPGVDVSELTTREKKDFNRYTKEFLAPCSDTPVSVAQCVREKRKCDECKPAAEFLKSRILQGRTRSQTEDAFRLRFAPESVKTIVVKGTPFKGPKDAAVTVVEWADFECPFCRLASPVFDRIVKQYEGYVRVGFKHYPLSARHEHAEGAARAAVAAQKQGKFWEMHHALFAKQETLGDRLYPKLAKDLGLDVKQFKKDWESEAVADAVSADRKAADKLDVDGTPTIYINGRHFDTQLFDLMKDMGPWIEDEVKLRTGKTVKAKDVPDPAPPSSAAPSASGLGIPSASAAPSASAKPASSAK